VIHMRIRKVENGNVRMIGMDEFISKIVWERPKGNLRSFLFCEF